MITWKTPILAGNFFESTSKTLFSSNISDYPMVIRYNTNCSDINDVSQKKGQEHLM